MNTEQYEIVKIIDNDFELNVNVSPREETIWLTQEQIALLFNVSIPAISKHINNILDCRELDISTISILETVRKEGGRIVKRKVKIFNLDMVISIGYRVNSKRGILFRKWANNVLKQYLLNNYVINDNKYHDRFLIIDDDIYLLGSSIKDIGKKRCVIIKTESFSKEMIFNKTKYYG